MVQTAVGDAVLSDRLPLVSVVTPTRNQAAFIEQTIRSVQKQTYPLVEHIVIDGASTDGTLDILRQYENEPRFRWLSQPDRGMYEAVNHGFALARGSIFAYLNSDDLYFPWSISCLVRALDETTDLVYGDALLMDNVDGTLRAHFQLPFRRSFLERIGSFAQPATAWRKSLHERVGGFDETLRSVADLDFYLRATAVGRARHVEEFIALMRLHAGMQTIAQRDRILAENQLVRSRLVRPSRAGDAAERSVAWLFRRRAWLRFVLASRGRLDTTDDRWGHFIATGVRLRYGRIVAGQLPTLGPRLLRGAVMSPVDWRSG